MIDPVLPRTAYLFCTTLRYRLFFQAATRGRHFFLIPRLLFFFTFYFFVIEGLALFAGLLVFSDTRGTPVVCPAQLGVL